MTFYQKLEMLCKSRGTTVTALATELGFSSSAGTTWKKSKGLPRNSTLKKIADYFEIGIEELEAGVSVPIDYDSVDTSAFNQEVWQHLLEKNEYNEQRAIDAYMNFERAQMRDAISGNTVQDNHGIIGHAHAPVTIINGSERQLTKQETVLIEMFEKMDAVQQARLLTYAADLTK